MGVALLWSSRKVIESVELLKQPRLHRGLANCLNLKYYCKELIELSRWVLTLDQDLKRKSAHIRLIFVCFYIYMYIYWNSSSNQPKQTLKIIWMLKNVSKMSKIKREIFVIRKCVKIQICVNLFYVFICNIYIFISSS